MLDEATREFRQVVEMRPSDGSGFFYLGLIALKQGHWEAAVGYLSQAVERGGPRAAVLANLGLSYEKAGRLEEAEAAYAEAAALARRDPRVLTGWGIVALHRGDFEVAAGRLDRAAELAGDATLPPIWYWARGLAAAASDQLDRAAEVLREGSARHGENPVLRNNLAVLLEVLGDADGAMEILRAELASDPVLPQVPKNLGDLLYRAAQYDEAWEMYQHAVRVQPTLGDDVYFKLGNIAYKRLDRAAAGEYWNRALELNPRHELARSNLETMGALV
jgi:tetratricopeptide (TPR) repeat protein